MSRPDEVLSAVCSLSDSLLTPIIDDLNACVTHTEAAGRRNSAGLSPRVAMATEDLKVHMHKVCGNARQYVIACKDVASYVSESGVLDDVEKGLASRGTEELESFMSDLGEYFSQCLSRLKQFLAEETKFRTEVLQMRHSLSQQPAQEQRNSMKRLYFRVSFVFGTLSLALLLRYNGFKSYFWMGSLFFVAVVTFLTCERFLWSSGSTSIPAIQETRERRWEEGPPSSEDVRAFCDTMRRVDGNAEIICKKLATTKTCLEGWLKNQRHSSPEEVDYERVKAELQRLKLCMEKTIRDAKEYLK